MKAISATWKNGQILPNEPVNWPDGCRLSVEPIEAGVEIGMREEDWSNSPEAIADWLKSTADRSSTTGLPTKKPGDWASVASIS